MPTPLAPTGVAADALYHNVRLLVGEQGGAGQPALQQRQALLQPQGSALLAVAARHDRLLSDQIVAECREVFVGGHHVG